MEQMDKVQSGLVECIEREVIMNEAVIAHEMKVWNKAVIGLLQA